MGTIANKISNIIDIKQELKILINLSTPEKITAETLFKNYPKLLLKGYINLINNGIDELNNQLNNI